MVSPFGEYDLRGVHGEDHGASSASGSKTPPPDSRDGASGDSDATTNISPPPKPEPGAAANGAGALKPALPDFDLVKRIDGGGFGDVWTAKNQHTGRYVAVKILRAHEDVELAALRIVQQAVSNHPNLTPIEHVGRTQEHLYMVMPLADCASSDSPAVDVDNYRALTLDRHIAKAMALPPAEIASIGADLASALDQLHRNGIVHGDVKPTNVLRIGGVWRLGDYSLSVFTDERRRVGQTREFSPPDGTVGPGADLYALGVTLFRMTGRPEGDLKALLEDELHDIEGRDSALLSEIRSLCSACRPGGSFSAGEASERLRRLARGPDELSSNDRLRMHIRRSAPVLIRICVIALAATLLAASMSQIVFTRMTDLNVRHWSWLRGMGGAAIAANLEQIDNVVVIAMRDSTPFEELGVEAGLSDVTPENLQSLRRLHGELCRRLSTIAPRAVVWDITFRSESPFDEDFIAGIRSLMSRGVGVVATSYGWHEFTTIAPPISPTIWETGVRWGSNHVVLDPTGAIWAPLVVERADGEGLPSIILASYAAWRRPDAWFDVSIDRAKREAVIEYWRPVGNRPDRRETIGREDRVALTTVQRYERPIGRGRDPGIRDTDLLGTLQIEIAPDEALEAATINYEEIFLNTPSELRHALGDKVVIIGDFRQAARDYHRLPGRDLVYGPHILASGIELAISQAGLRTPHSTMTWITAFVAVLLVGLGVEFGFSLRGRSVARGVATLGVVLPLTWVGLFAFSVLSYRYASAIYTPYPAILATLLAATFAASWLTIIRHRPVLMTRLKGSDT